MRIVVVGTGYVGLVTGVCFSEMGNHVTCVDIDKKKLENLKKGIIPIYEPGLKPIVLKNYQEGLLKFTFSLAKAMEDSSVYFIAVGTPAGDDGSADLQYVLSVAKKVGENLDKYAIIINKSTVPVGTANKVRKIIQQELDKRGVQIEFDVVSNPEFLKEGNAVDDFMHPDRIIIGTDSKKATEIMRKLYSSFSRNRDKLHVMGLREAEMTKYVANSLLATKISFMNEIADLCEILDVDVENVRKGIGSDSRIGYSFLYPGCGYGGSCFPKDVKALISISNKNNFNPILLNSVEQRNNFQKKRLFEKIIEKFGSNLNNFIFGIWGLSFKPGTNDMRESSSTVLINLLITAGARVLAYDPVAMDEARHEFSDEYFKSERLVLTDHQYDAVKSVDAMILVTEWKVFCQPDFDAMKRLMKNAVIFDGRNQYDPKALKEMGFFYSGIGRN